MEMCCEKTTDYDYGPYTHEVGDSVSCKCGKTWILKSKHAHLDPNKPWERTCTWYWSDDEKHAAVP